MENIEKSPRQPSKASKFWLPSLSTVPLVLCIIVSTIAIGIQIFKQQKHELDDIGKVYQATVNGRKVSVIDSPDLFETTLSADESFKQQKHDLDDIVLNPDEELRILLVGKTGVGKSATGNTILGRKVFKSEISSSSVTAQCEKHHAIVNRRKIYVIDSPGLFDTGLNADEVINRIKGCISFSAPGPHVFLVVIQLGRFTDEEENAVQIIQTVFGEVASTYTMVLFTHGDRLEGKTIHKFVRDSSELVSFIKTCSGRYHVFNNKDKNPDQVIQLLDQIDKLVTGNGGQHYTTEMLEMVERAIEREKLRILKEMEEQRLKEIEELRVKLEHEAFMKAKERLNKDYEQKARWQAEREPSILEKIYNVFKGAVQYFFG